MKNRADRGRVRGGWSLEGLESRSLPSAGLSPLTDMVQELGTVSRSAAVRGVEVTALVDPGTSVTFRFDVEAAGNYTLLVRHIGAGLTLRATGPAGSAAIDPGPAGPFQVVPLDLSATTYEVKASAEADLPVFVDWELLMNSGVGQLPATATVEIIPAIAMIPAATPTPTSLPDSTGGATITAPADLVALPVAAAVDFARGWGSASSIVGEPVGHPGRQPAAPLPANAEVLNPDDVGSALTRAEVDTTLIIALQPTPRTQVAATLAPTGLSWWEALFGAAASDESVEPTADAIPAAADLARLVLGPPTTDPGTEAAADDPTPENRVSLAAISPGLLFGAVAVAVVTRSRTRGDRRVTDLTLIPSSSPSSPESTPHRLRAIFDRSYRPDRCQQVRPLPPRSGPRR